MCFIRFFEQTEIIFLYSFKLLLTYSMEQSPSEKLTASQLVKKFPPPTRLMEPEGPLPHL